MEVNHSKNCLLPVLAVPQLHSESLLHLVVVLGGGEWVVEVVAEVVDGVFCKLVLGGMQVCMACMEGGSLGGSLGKPLVCKVEVCKEVCIGVCGNKVFW